MSGAKTNKKSHIRTNTWQNPDMSSERVALDGDPKVVAQSLVALIPLDAVCENEALKDAFLSEMFLAVARASSRKERRQKQAEGIAAAKARGVQFGKKSPPLPENFEMMHRVWRNGDYSLAEAAKMCGMPKSTFYNAVQRVEEADARRGEEEEARRVVQDIRNIAAIKL